jgi:hypothetical protein
MSKSRLLAMAALVATGALGVGVAQAQETQVNWSITIGMPAPVVPVLPAPVIVRPAPVVVQPALHDVRYPQYEGRYPQYEERYPHYEAHYHQPTRWDRDGDGIPNRYDRLYNPSWDRDGDGMPRRPAHAGHLAPSSGRFCARPSGRADCV